MKLGLWVDVGYAQSTFGSCQSWPFSKFRQVYEYIGSCNQAREFTLQVHFYSSTVLFRFRSPFSHNVPSKTDNDDDDVQ